MSAGNRVVGWLESKRRNAWPKRAERLERRHDWLGLTVAEEHSEVAFPGVLTEREVVDHPFQSTGAAVVEHRSHDLCLEVGTLLAIQSGVGKAKLAQHQRP